MTDRRRERIAGELKGLFGVALALTGDRGLAEDLVQETALKALSARRVPHEGSGFRAWLFRILRNAAVDAQRRGRWMAPTDPEEVAERLDGGQVLAAAGDALADVLTVRFALTRLKPSHREIIGLVDIAGLGYCEAAELLGIPPGTVMSRISRARATLANEIAGSNVLPLAAARRRRSG